MKIAFIGRGNLKTNASTIRALRLGKILSVENYEIHLFLPKEELNISLSEDLRFRDIKFHLCGRGITEFFSKLLNLCKDDYEYIHTLNVGVKSFLVGYLYKLFKDGTKIILDIDEKTSILFNSKIRNSLLGCLENFALKKSDIVLVASKYLFELFSTKRKGNLFYFPYAIEDDVPEIGLYKNISDFNTKDGYKYLVYMGTYQNYSELELILSAADKLQKLENKLYFLMVGDGPNKNILEEECLKKNINIISFLGFLTDDKLKEIFDLASVFIFPINDNEINRSRCPNKIFEYLKYKKPIVTNPVGEVYNILDRDAHYFKENSQEDFVARILEAITLPKIPSDKRIISNLWSRRANDYIKIISEVQDGFHNI